MHRVKFRLHRMPLKASASHIGLLLLGGDQDFFLKVNLSARNARHSVWTLRSVWRYAFSSRSVRSGFPAIAARMRSASTAHFGVRRLVREGATLPNSRRSYLTRCTHDSLT